MCTGKAIAQASNRSQHLHTAEALWKLSSIFVDMGTAQESSSSHKHDICTHIILRNNICSICIGKEDRMTISQQSQS